MPHTAITRIVSPVPTATTAVARRQLESVPLTTTAAISATANHYASAAAFTDYLSRKAERTVTSHRQDLVTFASFLETAGLTLPMPVALQQSAEP